MFGFFLLVSRYSQNLIKFFIQFGLKLSANMLKIVIFTSIIFMPFI